VPVEGPRATPVDLPQATRAFGLDDAGGALELDQVLGELIVGQGPHVAGAKLVERGPQRAHPDRR
jgi:hypothetical protein